MEHSEKKLVDEVKQEFIKLKSKVETLNEIMSVDESNVTAKTAFHIAYTKIPANRDLAEKLLNRAIHDDEDTAEYCMYLGNGACGGRRVKIKITVEDFKELEE